METIFVSRSCCFGILGLRAGSLIVAYTYLVADLVMSTVIISGEAFLHEVKNSLDESQHPLLPEIRNTEGIMLGLWFLMLPFITSLLVGLHKNQAIYVKIYLMGVFAYMILEVTMLFICFFYNSSILILSVRFIVLAIEMYFLLIVGSHYYTMIRVQGN